MIRRLIAEVIGALLLAAAVIGSGIMAERISGAHFNPVISLVAAVRGELDRNQTAAYVAVQVAGCCAGAMLANAMFELPLVHTSLHHRFGFAQWLAEIVATGGLVLVVLASPSFRDAAWRVAAWIGGAYWFTSSTSFANPAITIGRSLSDTFAGIHPADVPAFVAAQLVGGALGFALARLVLPSAGDSRVGRSSAEERATR